MKKFVYFLLMCAINLVYANVEGPIFNLERAQKIYQEAEALQKLPIVKLRRFKIVSEKIKEQIEESKACILRQNDKRAALEQSLKYVNPKDSESSANTSNNPVRDDISYLKSKIQNVDERLGACSLFNIKADELLSTLNETIVTTQSARLRAHSNAFILAMNEPLNALNGISIVKENAFVSDNIYSKIFQPLVALIIVLIAFSFKSVVRLMASQGLNTRFIKISFYTLFSTLFVYYAWDTYYQFQYSSESSSLIWQWLGVALRYLVVMIYGYLLCFLHPKLKIKKAVYFGIILLMISFVVNTVIALYSYPYIAFRVADTILSSLGMTLLLLVYFLAIPSLSRYLFESVHLDQKDGEKQKASVPVSLECRAIVYAIAGYVFIYWYKSIINLWNGIIVFPDFLLKWPKEGFLFLSILISPAAVISTILTFGVVSLAVIFFVKKVIKLELHTFKNIIFLFSALVALVTSGMNLTGIAVIAGALSVGIGMGLKGIVNNFVSGLILLVEKPIHLGDRIIVNGYEGYVKKIGVRSTEIESLTNTDIIIPNEELINTTVINYSLYDDIIEANVITSISYDADFSKVEKVICETVQKNSDTVTVNGRFPWVFIDQFADSCIQLKVFFLVKKPALLLRARGAIGRALLEAYKENNLEFPYPQRDIHIKDTEG